MGSKCLIATVMVANGRDYRRIEGIGRFKGDPAVVGSRRIERKPARRDVGHEPFEPGVGQRSAALKS
jgi:hypothetical protein